VLEGIDGTQRMSKSLGNYIGIDEPANEVYGKVMSIPDNLIYPYFELITDVSLNELKDIKSQLADSNVNPRDVKRSLGRTIVEMYNNEQAGKDAEEEFDRVFRQKKLPDEIKGYALEPKSYRILDLMVQVETCASKGEARRLVTQGGVSIDGEKVSDPFIELKIDKEMILKVGKRKFAKIYPK
jgi:tyrosyl-tRNA synthetase